MGAADEKALLAAQLKAKEQALHTAMNKTADYDPSEVRGLEQQVCCNGSNSHHISGRRLANN